MNKLFYIGVDLHTAEESNHNSSVMHDVFKNIRDKICESENSGVYWCVVKLQSNLVNSYDFICKVLLSRGYKVKIVDNNIVNGGDDSHYHIY